MSFVNLNKVIKDILIASGRFADVFDYETIQFKGDPVAFVVPSENQSDYETTTENQRTYVFNVRVFVERKVKSPAETETRLRGLMDAVLDDFEKSENWTLTQANLPTGYTLLVLSPTPSSWGYVDISNSTYRFAEFKVSIRVSIDCNIIN